MTVIVFFLTVFFLYALASRRLQTTLLTAPMVFTVAGILYVYLVRPESRLELETFLSLAEIALVLTLFSDATRISLRSALRLGGLPGRLLGIGMPLIILVGLFVAALVFPQLTIWEAGILAVILSPTDLGLGSAVVNSKRVPIRIRHALSLEGGLNDGLALPFLMLFLALAIAVNPAEDQSWIRLALELIGIGVVVGALIGGLGGWLLGRAQKRGWVNEVFRELGLLSIAVLCFLVGEHLGGSGFIAAFVGGLAVKLSFQSASEQFAEFTEATSLLLDYLVFFLFGLLVGPILGGIGIQFWLYAILSLTLIRMVPVALSLTKTGLSGTTKLFMGWFGPRGLASIVLGLVFLEQEAELEGTLIIQVAVATTVLVSIFAHGFSSAPGISWYARQVERLPPEAPERQELAEA